MNDAGLLAEAWPYEYEDPNCYVTSLFGLWMRIISITIVIMLLFLQIL